MEKCKVWILLSKPNNYNQPERVFENIFFNEPPTKEELSWYEFKENDNMYRGWVDKYGNEYWVEMFTN